jgi:hypothetical protein
MSVTMLSINAAKTRTFSTWSQRIAAYRLNHQLGPIRQHLKMVV